MAVTTSGISRYTVVEASNVTLGQLGFDVIVEGAAKTEGTFIAIKAIGGPIDITTETGIGDVLTTVSIESGDIVYGAFTSVLYNTSSEATGTCIAYRG